MTTNGQKGHGQKLGRKFEQAIAALLAEPSIDKAAVAVGVAPKTLLRWLKDAPGFRQAYLDARRELVSQTVARLQHLGEKAVETLVAVMDDDDAPASARVSAARGVLEMGLKGVEVEDLASRIEQLEQPSDQKSKPAGIVGFNGNHDGRRY